MQKREEVMAKNRKSKKNINVSPHEVDTQFRRGVAGGIFGALVNFDVTEQPSLPDQTIESDSHIISKTIQKTEDKASLLQPLGPQRVLKLAISKKGRGGKVVTTLQTIEQSDHQSREALGKVLGKALGCRVWREDSLLCLQGDQRDRVRSWVATQQ